MATLVVTDKAGQVLEPGAIVTDFRGDTAVLVRGTRAGGEGYSGKVAVEYPGRGPMDYYDRVFDLTVTEAL